MTPQEEAMAVRRALAFVGIVHNFGPQQIGKHLAGLTRRDLEVLTITLAAMVPENATPEGLLAWLRPDERHTRPLSPTTRSHLGLLHRPPLKDHGTHAAYNRHKAHGETPCAECIDGERIYQHQRHLRRKAAA